MHHVGCVALVKERGPRSFVLTCVWYLQMELNVHCVSKDPWGMASTLVGPIFLGVQDSWYPRSRRSFVAEKPLNSKSQWMYLK